MSTFQTLNPIPVTRPLRNWLSLLLPQIEMASRSVYELDQKTRLDRLTTNDGRIIYAKREDTSIIHSYKWRGAYFKLKMLVDRGNPGPFVAASAGNHAQGVALAAQKLGVKAAIFMPKTTPELKQNSVCRLGGQSVSVQLCGDCFEDALANAMEFCRSSHGTMIEAFDDLSVIAGQATVGLELLEQKPTLTKLYVPIGGGGLASGIATAIKVIRQHPCAVVGVEVDGQHSMRASMNAGQRVVMADIDRFCDGTAVRQPGRIPFELCRQFLDDVVTVSNSQVSSAIQVAWESGRFIPEPSGAIALAASAKFSIRDRHETVGVVISGSNTDFKTLPRIVQKGETQKTTRRFYRFKIKEQNGTLIELLDAFLLEMNIVDFQYGKSSNHTAYPILGIDGPRSQLDEFSERINSGQIAAEEMIGIPFSEFRVIPFRPEHCQDAIFLKIDFPNRPGALRELMRKIFPFVSICYFNFVETGEMEGHALIGFEFSTPEVNSILIQQLNELSFRFQTVNMPAF